MPTIQSFASGRELRLAILGDRPVDAPYAGGPIRLRSILSSIPEPWRVTYVQVAWGGADSRHEISSRAECVRWGIPLAQKVAHRIWTGGRVDPCITFASLMKFSPALIRKIRSTVSHVDVVGASPFHFAALTDMGFEGPKLHWSENCEADLIETWANGLSSRKGKARIARLILQAESRAFRSSDLNVLCTHSDLSSMKSHYGEPRGDAMVVPNGVRTDVVQPASPERRASLKRKMGIASPLVLFVASGGFWLPNVQAGRFICDHLAPAIPEATFCLAGTIGLDVVGQSCSLARGVESGEESGMVFEEGWHLPERGEGSQGMRWTSGEAVLRVTAPDAKGVRLRVRAPLSLSQARLSRFAPGYRLRPVELTVTSGTEVLGTFQVPRDRFLDVAVPLRRAPDLLRLKVKPCQAASDSEPRVLGVAVTEVSCSAPSGPARTGPNALHSMSGFPANLLFTGWMDDGLKLDLLQAADVAINPMFGGSGSNLKMLEALAAGLPCVTTSHGARGLDVQQGREVLIAENNDFAEAVRALLKDESRRRDLGQAALKKVREAYDWRMAAARLGDRLLTCMDKGASRP